ncbi:uncharacterized protein LOC113654540 isoform X1 [Tachysurus fulvidraco]|uniref:uncharacterized protein LOC113654540 isoform X1 n=1 Tax=Tachysurus fulvidraco TaxID=1234273 RepID=UPI001FEE5653|nr:uncharacterized protein LOC113654540 isoform X1 [Tachysurus fulvidraco]XP_027020553.2 uncharacterized protein LOC113654540 isoform X1 [Tachysurus fulvidraco]
MKELVLSLLSRGYGHVVHSDGKRQYGRLEVCFEPEDYFIWKSQPPLLRFTSSGRLISGVETTPPKTYSTRRGPLILFSEDFASSFSQPDTVKRKDLAFGASRQEAEFEFYSLRDLTEAALVYSKKQAKVECHMSMTPMLPDPKPGTKHLQAHQRPGDEHSYLNQTVGEVENEEDPAFFRRQGNCPYPRPEQVRYQPRFLCFPRPNRPPPGPLPLLTPSPALRGLPATSMPTGPEDRSMARDSKTSFSAEVVTLKAQMSPIPETDAWEERTEQPEDHNVYMVAEHLTGYPKDLNGQWKQSAIDTGGEEGGHAPRTALRSLGCSHLSKVSNDRRQTEGGWHPSPVKQSGLHLPPIKQPPLADAANKDYRLKAVNMTQENHKEPIPRLPDIHQPEVSTETAAPKPPERTVLKKVLVLLPFEPMEQDGLSGLPKEKEEIEDVLCSDVEQKVELKRTEENRPIEHGCRLKAAQQDILIGFEPEEDKEQTAVGPLPPFIGRRGLGKQCSMAHHRQDPHDTADQSESQPGIIRGSLPLELRECQKDGLLGTLIMGPAGEIICLSFWDALTDTKDHPALEDAMKEHGVLEESWTILDQLAEQATQTGGMTDREVEAKRGHKKQTSTNPEACVPEQRIEKTNNYTENRPYSSEEGIMQQTGGRAQRPQPKARPRSGSPPTPGSDSSIQKTALSRSTAADENIAKTKLQTQTESYKKTVKPRKSGKLDNADDPHMSNVKKQKITRHANRDTDVDAENMAMELNVDSTDTESQDTSFSNEKDSGPIQKKNKNTDGEKTTKSTKSPNTAEKIKNKSKGQVAFVVGKPRQSQEVMQTERKKYSSERHEKTVSKRLVKKSKEKSADDSSCGSSEYTVDDMESREVSPVQKNCEARHSPDIDQDFIHHEKCVAGHSMESDDRVAVSREDDGTEDVDHFSEIDISAASSRTHSSAKSSSTSTWSIRRSSVSSDTGLYSPVQLPHHFPRLGVPTHHPASNPDKSKSAADAKSRAEAIKQRESRVAAAVAEKAERRRMEVEKKRKEKEEEKEAERKRQEDKDLTEERMRLELEEEGRQRAQQARLRKLKDEEERQKQAEREKEGQRGEQPEMEMERRRQEETKNKKRYLDRLQKARHEEEIRRAAELKRQHEEEEARKEEEYRRLQEMDESERQEYLRRKWEEEEERRKAAEERRHAREEAAMWYEELNRQRATLEQNLQFHRGLFVETEGLKQKQSISRPWVFSYFSRLRFAH